MNKKNTILAVSILGVLILYALFNTREFGICEIYCGAAINKYQDTFLFFPFILLFSLITYKLPESVFSAWWKFAQIDIPTIFLISFIISLGLHHSPGGFFNIDNEIDVTAYFLMYSIFVIGSLIQIYRGYRRK